MSETKKEFGYMPTLVCHMEVLRHMWSLEKMQMMNFLRMRFHSTEFTKSENKGETYGRKQNKRTN